MHKPRLFVGLALVLVALALSGKWRVLVHHDNAASPPQPWPLPSHTYSQLPPPTGLTITTLGGGYVALHWNPIAGLEPRAYAIYRDKQIVRYTAFGTTTDFADPDVEPGREYVYAVVAVDAEQNESIHSAEITVRTPALVPAPPTPVRDLHFTVVTQSSFSFFWQPPVSSGSGKLYQFLIVYDGHELPVGPAIYTHTMYWVPGSTHTLQVIAVNSKGLRSEATTMLTTAGLVPQQ